MSSLKKIIVKDKLFYPSVFKIALPIAAQSLITIGVNMLDNIMVGRIGETELSAVSLANTFISIYHILCMGLGMGASVLVSRYWGMRVDEPEKAMNALRKTISLMIRLTLSLALLFCVLSVFIPEAVMSTYTPDSAIQYNGSVYLRYSMITFFFLGLSLVCTIVLRSVGQVRIPLYVSIGAFFVNLFSNYVLIFGKLGLPAMGIKGAAIATLIARLFEASIICGYILFVDQKMSFRIKHLFMKASDLLPEYIRISIPVLISDGILALGNNSVSMVIGRLGQSFVAANSITATTQQMSNVLIQGVCQAGAIITGQTLGAGDREKASDQAYGFLGFGFILGLVSACVILAVSGLIIRSYNVLPETAQMAEQLMIAISFITLFQATNSIMTKGVLRGGGDTKMLMLADNIFLWVLSLPLGIVAGFWLHLSPFWIYVCLKADQVAKAIWCVLRLQSGKWIKKISA